MTVMGARRRRKGVPFKPLDGDERACDRRAMVSPVTELAAPSAPSKSVAEMAGEALRECAILIAVFGWLDRTIQGEPFWGPGSWKVIGFSIVLFVLGVAIERRRSPD